LKLQCKKVSELKPDEYFIWADDKTRDNMAVDYEPNDPDLQVLQVLSVKITKGDRYPLIRFKRRDGSTGSKWVQKPDLAILIKNPSRTFSSGVVCKNCGDKFGDHYLGLDARIYGIQCKEFGSKQWFVPEESSLHRLHPDLFGVADDFFASLGL
jgi:hypothetical protein